MSRSIKWKSGSLWGKQKDLELIELICFLSSKVFDIFIESSGWSKCSFWLQVLSGSKLSSSLSSLSGFRSISWTDVTIFSLLSNISSDFSSIFLASFSSSFFAFNFSFCPERVLKRSAFKIFNSSSISLRYLSSGIG